MHLAICRRRFKKINEELDKAQKTVDVQLAKREELVEAVVLEFKKAQRRLATDDFVKDISRAERLMQKR